ncbi:MAG: cytidine deaminase [Lachnospiraceae bacterium]|nr:cytidine deaminase [Lachnospiraceae bacterium]
MDYRALMEAAIQARENSYSPYSDYRVGAALLSDTGKVFRGCNVENAAFSPGICAERTAFVKAVSEGEHRFQAIAIVGGAGAGDLELTAPCGLCRQVMMEFCDPKAFEIVLGTSTEDYQVFTLEELLPLGFGPKNLRKQDVL